MDSERLCSIVFDWFDWFENRTYRGRVVRFPNVRLPTRELYSRTLEKVDGGLGISFSLYCILKRMKTVAGRWGSMLVCMHGQLWPFGGQIVTIRAS